LDLGFGLGHSLGLGSNGKKRMLIEVQYNVPVRWTVEPIGFA